MIDFKPGDRVIITKGEHTGRRGTITDHVKQLKAFDAVIQPGEIANQLRRKYEVPTGRLLVAVEPDLAAGLNWADVLVDVADLCAVVSFAGKR